MGEKTRTSRRRALKVLAGAGVASTAGCLDAVTGPNRVEELTTTVREKFGRFDGNPGAAVEAGYLPLGPLVKHMGWHFANLGLLEDAAKNGFSVTKPQVLTYNTDGETLLGVEWTGPANQLSRSPEFLSDVEAATYQVHKRATHVFATEDDTVQDPTTLALEEVLSRPAWTEFIPPEASLEPGDTLADVDFDSDGDPEERTVDFAVTHPTLIGLHFWAFTENPEGRFASIHPDIAEDGEDVTF